MLDRLRRSLQTAMLIPFIWTAAQAQQPAPAHKPAFETASIRPSQPTAGCASMAPPGGTFYTLTCVSLRNLIQIAYRPSYIDGGGSALDAYYDLRASTPDGELWTVDSVGPMMQQLLSDRFHLVAHAGKRAVSGYGMVVARGGPKLHPVAPESVVQGQKAGEGSQNFTAPGRIQGRGRDPRGIAGLLSSGAGAPIVDHTGLTGMFNIDLKNAPDNSTDSNLPSFFTAVEEQLGLKLIRKKSR